MSRFPTNILLAIDGSEDARLASWAVADPTRVTGSKLHVVHVLERFPRHSYPGVTPEVYDFVWEKQEREGRELLAAGLGGTRGGAAPRPLRAT